MLFSVSEKDLLTSSFQSGKHGLPSYPPPLPPPKTQGFPFEKTPKNLTSHTDTNHLLDFSTKHTA